MTNIRKVFPILAALLASGCAVSPLREVPAQPLVTDANGHVVLDKNGKPEYGPLVATDLWVDPHPGMGSQTKCVGNNPVLLQACYDGTGKARGITDVALNATNLAIQAASVGAYVKGLSQSGSSNGVAGVAITTNVVTGAITKATGPGRPGTGGGSTSSVQVVRTGAIGNGGALTVNQAANGSGQANETLQEPTGLTSYSFPAASGPN